MSFPSRFASAARPARASTLAASFLAFAPAFAVLGVAGIAACGQGSVLLSNGNEEPTDLVPTDAGAGAGADGATAPASEGGTEQATRVIVKPNGRGDEEITGAVRAAKRSVRLYVYLLTDSDVVNALIDRARAGVDVRVLMNRRFPSADTSDPTAAFDRLAAGRVRVAWAPAAFAYTHAKTLIVDDQVAWITTMNLTVAGSTTNREFLVSDQVPAHVTLAAQVFDADYADRSFSPPDTLLVSPPNTKRLLVALVGAAARSIDVEGETLSDPSLTAALVAARQRGVLVRVVVARDRTPTSAAAEATRALKAVQIPVVSFGAEAGTGTASVPYVHAKTLLVDGERAYVGSANFTTNAFENNREVGVVVTNTAAVRTIASTLDADFRAGRAL